ncbi:MAG TPA: SAM-dependent chlorinase/fluorinase [Pyrinomonadaceae bacterium]|nr:SAM-dependent chlorinase/fluorinase [Pyrinomonadaceae bacterium]
MVVTLLTDFGTADYYAGAMRGAVLAVNPEARVVDITHEIPAQDIESAAFTLLAAYSTFPTGTIHVAVVDPGVGSTRRPLVVVTKNYLFVGPDNGLFSHVCEREGEYEVFHLTNREFFRDAVSATFHGRDVFAPVAGALSLGVKPEELGERVADELRMESLAAVVSADGAIEGRVIHVDRFGNCVTNITRRELADDAFERGARLTLGGREITSLRRFYAEEAGAEDVGGVRDDEEGLGVGGEEKGGREPFAIWGSAGFLEISVNRDSAARVLNVARGRPVVITPAKAGG